MNPRVKNVIAHADYRVELEFENGEIRLFDVSPYLEKGIFKNLKNPAYFNRVKPFLGSIQWPGGQGFCPDTLYEDSKALSTTRRCS